MANPELQVTRTVVEKLVFVVFITAFEILRRGQITVAKQIHIHEPKVKFTLRFATLVAQNKFLR